MEDSDYAAKLIKSGPDWIVWARFGNDQKPAAVLAFELENGHAMDWTGWLTPKAYERTLEALHMLGFSGSDLDMMNNQEPHGRCRVTVKTEEYKGVSRQKIAFVNAATRYVREGDRLSVADLKKLSAENKKRSSGFDGNDGPPLGTDEPPF